MSTWIVTDELHGNDDRLTVVMWMDKMCSSFREASMISRHRCYDADQLVDYMKRSLGIEVVSTKMKLDSYEIGRENTSTM